MKYSTTTGWRMMMNRKDLSRYYFLSKEIKEIEEKAVEEKQTKKKRAKKGA